MLALASAAPRLISLKVFPKQEDEWKSGEVWARGFDFCGEGGGGECYCEIFDCFDQLVVHAHAAAAAEFAHKRINEQRFN